MSSITNYRELSKKSKAKPGQDKKNHFGVSSLPGFSLHPRLSEDTHRIDSLTSCELLLHRFADWPWFILVPRIENASELHALEEPALKRVCAEVKRVSEFTATLPGVKKINTGALGNLVPQLHIHVVGRSPRDIAWPGPVWGFSFSTETKFYTLEEISGITEQWKKFREGGQ